MNRLTLALSVLAGCTFGGSSEDPSVEVIDADASVLDATGTPITPVPPTAAADAGTTSDARATPPPVDAGFDAALPGADAAIACEPLAPVATCDPVRNTGCPPLTQCDIDSEQTVPTGRCVFAGVEAEQCSSSFVSNSCPAQFTCAQSTCRKMCYCDNDCNLGECCRADSAPGPVGAFRLCQAC